MRIAGSCHCRNITFTLDWTPDPSEIQARACTCSFCVKHGGVWTSCPTGSLEIRVADRSRVIPYTFGTATAHFQVCSLCGVVPVVTSQIDGVLYAVVSVNAFDGVDPALLRRSLVSFDGEGTGDRLARRQRNWIPRVALQGFDA